MKSRQILIAIVILGTVWHTAAAQPKKEIEVGAPPPEGIMAVTSMQSNPVLADLIALKPEMPSGPPDVLKSYELAMGMLADKTSVDCFVIVQAQQKNQLPANRRNIFCSRATKRQ